MRLLALAHKETLLLVRDPHALAVLFLMPVVLMLLMAFAMAGINREQLPAMSVALDVPTASAESDFFRAALAAGLGDGAAVADAPDGAPQVRLSPRFTADLLDSEASSVTLVLPALTDRVVRQQLRAVVNTALAQTRLQAFLVQTGELEPDLPLAEQLALIQERTQTRIEVLEQRADGELTKRTNSSQHSVPAWLIFGMFFITLPMAYAFQSEEQSGTLMRFQVLRLGLGTLVASKLLPYLAINLVQFALLLAIGRLGLPLLDLPALTFPGSPFGYLALALCLASATCALGLAVAALVRSPEQALLVGGGLNIILAAIGGIMVPKSVMPAAMLTLAELSPMSWALDGFLALLVDHASLAEILPVCGRLLLFALVVGGAGLLFFKNRLNDIQWTTLN